MNKTILIFFLTFGSCLISNIVRAQPNYFAPWQEGFFDIHHINTARGNTTFFIFPDGTTMLFDAGDKNIPQHKTSEYFPVTPNDSLSAGAWIATYIRNVFPAGLEPQIDYAVISHFHNDHYGEVDSTSKRSPKYNYYLSGITEVGDLLPIHILIDRGYPDYNDPVNLKSFYKNDKTFTNYQAFINAHTLDGMVAQTLVSGSKKQIVLKRNNKYKNFSVRNLKTNTTIWSGKQNETYVYPIDKPLIQDNDLDENALCLALKFSYGDFDYYTGGDLNGFTNWGGVDMETALAKSVGKVEVLALNHHGYYDATNTFFINTLAPRVIVHQAIHDPHFQPDVLKRLYAQKVDGFTFNMHQKIKDENQIYVDKIYKSTQGHIVIRVLPAGNSFMVYILNDQKTFPECIGIFGPYTSEK